MKQFNNRTTSVIKIDNVIKTKTTKQKIVGLLRTAKPSPLYLQTRFGIHTFGMRYPIDVVILDNKFIVQKIRVNLKPNAVFLWDPRYQHVLELPIHTIVNKQIHIGQKIAFQ